MYDLLFSPGKIGGLTLPNRIAMTAASASLSQPDGTMTEDMLAYYEARAKGGVGLIITEMVCVDEDRGVLFPRELNAAREENIPSFRRLADRVHPHGTKIFAQLFHPGANADPKLNPLDLISASPARGKKRGQARAATAEEIHAIAAKFGQAARRVQEAGFDGVEVHAGHHYFLHSFLSPVTNHRTDRFGGSLAKPHSDPPGDRGGHPGRLRAGLPPDVPHLPGGVHRQGRLPRRHRHQDLPDAGGLGGGRHQRHRLRHRQ